LPTQRITVAKVGRIGADAVHNRLPSIAERLAQKRLPGTTRSGVASGRLLYAGSLLIGTTLFCSIGIWAQDRDQPAGQPASQRLDAKQAADLEKRLAQLYSQLAPSIVRIPNPKREGGFSGVIVSSSGEILTCAHHGLSPNTKVTVELADGRQVKATMLGSVRQKAGAHSSYYAADVGMVLLNEKGDWPAAKLGRSADLKPGSLCLALGYPNVHKPGQSPLVRLGRGLAPLGVGLLRTTCRIHPGDSGGPLFDLDGRVLGVHTAMESLKTGVNWHSPIESFQGVRQRLGKGEIVELAKDLSAMPAPGTDQGGAWVPSEELQKTLSLARAGTVEVVGDGKVIALGLIVDKDGWVLTKRTELTGPSGPRRLVCKLSDGSQLEARVMAESRAHDLALLKVAGKGLPAVRWAKQGEPHLGQLIASLGPGPEPLHYAVVAGVRVNNPGIKGELPIRVQPAPAGSKGARFVEFVPKRLEIEEARGLLQAGDLITHLDGAATPTADAFAKVRAKLTAGPDALEGEWLKLTVARDKKTVEVFLPLVAGPGPLPIPWKDARWNVRRNGFPNVFCHDGAIAYDRCGGPVVNLSGEVIGVNIARADPIQTFAIPSDVVQKVVTELKAR
jgi:serine protease Do